CVALLVTRRHPRFARHAPPPRINAKIESHLRFVGQAEGVCLGLTYKPKTDDMRDAPSLVIVPELQAAGARVVAYDPEGLRTAKPLLPGVEFADNAYACLKGADAAVVVTEWDEFRALDLARVKASLAAPIMVDLRNIYPIKAMKALGFRYVCVGRGFGGEG
ncbi:MAG: UDP binding domain-containing protein, partial [Roseiarcus sp.]|uniref:UDP binding domain-containing protein n=1 Tax=Roseiarcus sp. TaxID=1969460 RepID=UPI003C6719ED